MAKDFKYKATVGFPVYNVEHYVYRSLESVLNQDFDNYEVIVVDDCGTDNSMKVIEELIGNHPNGDKVRIISHQKNILRMSLKFAKMSSASRNQKPISFAFSRNLSLGLRRVMISTSRNRM